MPAAGKRAKPVDVTDVGAAEPSSSPGLVVLASASATVGVGAPEVAFPQGGEDYCVAYAAASAVHHAGDATAAAKIAALAPDSLKQPTGTNRVKWVQTQCLVCCWVVCPGAVRKFTLYSTN